MFFSILFIAKIQKAFDFVKGFLSIIVVILRGSNIKSIFRNYVQQKAKIDLGYYNFLLF